METDLGAYAVYRLYGINCTLRNGNTGISRPGCTSVLY